MRYFWILFLALGVASVQAQNTPLSLSGTITDDVQGPIANASVRVLNTNLGAVTDSDGHFTIENISRGKYAVQVSAIGYATRTEVVDIGAEHTADITFALSETTTQLGDVVVTAEKYEEDKQRIPATVSTLTSAQVEQYRIWNTRDITAIIPNLSSNDSGDGRNVTSIRGITTTSYDPAVATYIDGVNQFSLDTYIPQLFDVERIEVLSGPQGTLYGRNAMAGVINIITKQPTNTPGGFGEISAGTYGQMRYALGYRTPLVPNKLFFGISGVFDRTSGFYTNEYDNSDFDKRSAFTGNYYLRYFPTSRWALTFNMKSNSNRNNGAFPLAGSVDEARENPFTVNQNAMTRLMDNTFNASLVANHSGDRLNFSSQTAYQSNYRYYKDPIDGDFSPFDIVTIINNYGKDWNNVKVFTQEFKLSSPASLTSPFKWTLGTYLFHQNNPVKQTTRFGEDAGMYGIDDANFSTINTTQSYSNGVAFFGQGTYTLLDRLDVTLGLRYDYEHKKQTVRGEYQHDPDPEPMFETQPDTTGTANFNALSPKISVVYRINDHAVYATYSRGFRAGGMTPLGSDPSQPPLYVYKPEYSGNLEVGTKHHFFDNKLMANLSLFYVQVTDVQVPSLVLPDAITVTRNAGKLTSKGVDLQLSATPLKGFQVDYSLGVNDAKFQRLKLAQNGDEVDLKGNRQIFTPAFTQMIALQYGHALGPLTLSVRGELMELGRQYFDLANTIIQNKYGLVNMRVGAAYDRFELMFWGRNLTDEHYIAYAYDFGATHLGNPRNIGVTFRVNF